VNYGIDEGNIGHTAMRERERERLLEFKVQISRRQIWTAIN